MAEETPAVHHGRCQCGVITYHVRGPLRPAVACHCRMCQRLLGNHAIATACADIDLTIDNHDRLTWFQSSTEAKRAFCSACGSNLFYKRVTSDTTSIFTGSLDQPSGVTLDCQIHVEDAGDYYPVYPDIPSLTGEEMRRRLQQT